MNDQNVKDLALDLLRSKLPEVEGMIDAIIAQSKSDPAFSITDEQEFATAALVVVLRKLTNKTSAMLDHSPAASNKRGNMTYYTVK